MKKFFSFFAAVLFAGSMMAIDFTLTSASSVTKDGVTVTFAKGDGNNDPAWYDNGLRLYASNTVTVASATPITAITFNWEKQGQKAFNTATASTGSYTHPTEPGQGTWTGSATSVTFTLGATGQLQLNTFSVTVGEGGGEGGQGGGEGGQGGEGGEGGQVAADTLTCAQAAEQALAGKTDEVIIKGYVTEMVEEWSSHKNVSFWMADTKGGTNTFEAYRVKCETAAEAPTVGALVWVKGKLTKYTKNEVTIPETAAGGTFGILAKGEDVAPAQNLGEKTIAEFLSLKNKKDTCVLTGIVANIKTNEDGSYNKYGNFDLVELDNDEVSVYVYGLLTAAGENQKFQEMGIDEGDTLTCKAVYKEYNGKAEAENAIFVSVKKGEGGGEEEELFYDYEPEEATTLNITFKGISITDYTAEYGVVDIILTDNEEGDYEEALEWAYLEFVTSSYDDEAGLPAGTYQINDSEAEGTFTASPGGDDDYDYPCYLGVPADEEGYYNPYYIVSGTVTISAEGIEVNAKSYFGSTLKLVYNAPKDAVETTKIAGKAVKSLENGALYLDNNGVRYNVIGQTVR
jgi:hypothetical protein